ncbi:MAG: Rrf2 family transcriptional regulator, partial [Sediminibacterium sp.]|nr:Rrf2 family transcriptional regulator [Sediminibacterium sp.]
ILLELKKENLLDSKKGRGGGYFFKTQPNNIKLSKIIRLLDGPIALISCVSLNYYEKCADCDEKNCKIHHVFCAVRDATLVMLENKTIADFI